ncbi:MAG TPA: hypothetical protein VNB24_01330 [Acidimicrobiales bacterium]|nr:hypothetical protein [Acidimicrobiales bacterium]
MSTLAWLWWGGPGYSPEVFFVVTAVVALFLGVAGPARQSDVAIALGAGPLLLAGFTTDVGDRDGLWVLVFPMLIVWSVFLAFIAAVADRLVRRVGLEPGRRLLAPRSAGVFLLAAAVTATALVQSRWVHQWDTHEEALGAFPRVNGARVLDERRNSRCRLACPEGITRVVSLPASDPAVLEQRWLTQLAARGLAGVRTDLHAEDYEQEFPRERRTRVVLTVRTPGP